MAPGKGKTLRRRSKEEGLCMEQGGLIDSIVEINHPYFFDAIVEYKLE